MGCGTQRDQGRPVRLIQLDRKTKQERTQAILAGHTSSMVLDREARLWLAGTWRTNGDGGPGQTFIIYKPLEELAEYEVHEVAAGADTIQCLATPTLDGQPIAGARPMVLAWGDGAQHAELGLIHRSSSPDVLMALQPLAPLAVAAGRHTNFWLVAPDQAYSELPRFPETIESSSTCLVCQRGGDEDDATLLECGRCENPYHLSCLNPPLSAVPEGDWLCVACRAEDVDKSEVAPEPSATPSARKRRRL